MILYKSQVAKEIAKKLNTMKDNNNIVILHSRQIHRQIIEQGRGSCSTDRYIRKMRELGLISYEDPRRNNYLYEIKLNDKFFDYFEEVK